MRRHIATLFGVLLALFALAGAAAAEKVICPVCRVHEGEADPEPVKAASVYEGTTYGFCSAKCKQTFDDYPEAYLPPVLPRPVPAFTLKTLDGQEVSFSSLAAGKPVLVDFWATWCAPCLHAMPQLEKLQARHAGAGFSVIGISIDEEHARVTELAAKKKPGYPIYLDATATPAWSTFHVRSIPAAFLVDAEGRIVEQWLGKVDMREVERAVAKLVG
jgi:thiol-disulfide isomerase/thioredoxin